MDYYGFYLDVGVFIVPYLNKCKINIHRAIGCATLTSTVFSAIAGILLAISGMRVIGIHHGNIGFVNVILLAFSIIPSSLCGYLGARISTKLPQTGLKKIYAMFNICHRCFDDSITINYQFLSFPFRLRHSRLRENDGEKLGMTGGKDQE